MFLGGLQNGQPSNRLVLFNTTSETWTTLSNSNGSWPPVRFGHAAALIAGTMYVFGGTGSLTETTLSDSWALDLASCTWTQMHGSTDTRPEPRSYISMAYTGNNTLVMVGGVNTIPKIPVYFNDTWTWNVVTDTWTLLSNAGAPIPKCGSFLMQTMGNGQVVMYGGAYYFGQDVRVYQYQPTQAVFAFDPAMLQWRQLALSADSDVPKSLAEMTFASLGSGLQLLLVGGVTDEEITVTDVALGFFVNANVWKWQLLQTTGLVSRSLGSTAIGYNTSGNGSDVTVFALYGATGSTPIDEHVIIEAQMLQVADIGCNPGYFASDFANELCQPCPLGTFAPSAATASCTPCPAGATTSVTGAISNTSCFCTPGFRALSLADTYTCVPCPVGSYSQNSSALNCTQCPFGTTTSSAESITVLECNLCVSNFSCHSGSCSVDPVTRAPICSCSIFLSPQSQCTSISTLTLGLIAGIGGTILLVLVIIIARRAWRRSQAANADLRVKMKSQEEEFENAWKINESEIYYTRMLGEGAFGEVWQGLWGDRPVAVKKLRVVLRDQTTSLPAIDSAQSRSSTSSRAQVGFEREIKVIRRIKHINIVLCYGAGVTTTDGCLFLVLELCSRGSLLSILKNKSIEWPVQRQIITALHISRGLQYLHNMKPISVHRDIKSPNVLISEGWIAKIADFGSTKLLEAETLPHAAADKDTRAVHQTIEDGGSLLWMAPEVLQHLPYSTQSDVYRSALHTYILIT